MNRTDIEEILNALDNAKIATRKLLDERKEKPVEKKKVKRWLWVNMNTMQIEPWLASEETFRSWSDPSYWKKLPWSETEFEE